MAAVPLVGPFDGSAARLHTVEPGRLAIDDLVAGERGAGWVEPGGVADGTAMVRVSTAAVRSDAAVAETLAAVFEQARAAGVRRLVLDADDADRDRVVGGAAAHADALDVVLVPPLRVTNSLGRQVQRFVPLHPGAVGMYSCGPTVYSYAHLGNMRAYVFSDTLKRVLRWRGFSVRHVVNITDVGHLLADADQGEDKVEEASRREGRTVEEITAHYTDAFMRDLHALNVEDADEWPRASTYVPPMINFAKLIEDHGYSYALPQGLYFDTSRQADYGALAGIDRTALRSTGRVEDVEGRRHPSDFALWRSFTDGRQRLMQWDSPWGVGAPGWHLECSVMSMSLLGDHFDVHTGGVDHRELHHVNEIAQSEAYLEDGRPWVRYWLHNEFLNFKGSKMAKSAGGILRLADIEALGVHPLAYRFLLLQSHYGSQMAFSETLAEAAHQALRRLALRLRTALDGEPLDVERPVTLVDALEDSSPPVRERVLALDAAAADDLQTPSIVALVNEWSRDPVVLSPPEWAVLLRAVNAVTGLRLGALGPEAFVPPVPDELDVAWVEDRLGEREAARAVKDWALADRMRNDLAAKGVRVEDTPEGTHWYYAGTPG